MDKIQKAKEHFAALVEAQLARVERMKQDTGAIDYHQMDKIIIGCCGGDGIGPAITAEAERVLRAVLKEEIEKGKIEFRQIEGLTIENRIEAGKAIPDDVLEALKACDIILKGPTTTPSKGDGPNIESANVAMRRELDLFANVRPVAVPELGIDWTFFRENTEGEYALGSKGIVIDEDMSFDFKVTTTQGTERIARQAFEFARKNGKKHVAIITKANILKKTDGKFLELCYHVAKDYPEIQVDDWFVDIISANLINEKVRTGFEVFVLPNLYGDIITDEAAQIQGGVGTAGSANIGNKYAMFEAIHGSAPRMLETGRQMYANPASMIKAAELLLRHIGYVKEADNVLTALKIANDTIKMTGRSDGATGEEFANCVIANL
ncbi:isocitrate/isopropylmalate family dehydrogenase [Sporanaerobium hydrogeniformans]|uniref:isocitrate/isopropylmalate family dehydrogenase n=1 Tax=Sporanaerobium hydrogeniformans TaxID=3072179 RepID=UPI0015D4A7C8|nr:isocitrate/isopropylmalate family dehydrogenase [Sporanaerobium hydrogeniformans]